MDISRLHLVNQNRPAFYLSMFMFMLNPVLTLSPWKAYIESDTGRHVHSKTKH